MAMCVDLPLSEERALRSLTWIPSWWLSWARSAGPWRGTHLPRQPHECRQPPGAAAWKGQQGAKAAERREAGLRPGPRRWAGGVTPPHGAQRLFPRELATRVWAPTAPCPPLARHLLGQDGEPMREGIPGCSPLI